MVLVNMISIEMSYLGDVSVIVFCLCIESDVAARKLYLFYHKMVIIS